MQCHQCNREKPIAVYPKPVDLFKPICNTCTDDNLKLWRSGEQAKDEGIDLVLANSGDWYPAAMACCKRFLPHAEVIHSDDFKILVLRHVGEPHVPQCWGALVNRLHKAGIIEATGNFKKSKAPKNHAHPYTTWRRVE
jgi:hypothetical protein